jgi:hypothetical protein
LHVLLDSLDSEIPFRRNTIYELNSCKKTTVFSWRLGNRYFSATASEAELSPSHCSHVVPFSLSLVEERGQVLPNENGSVDLGSLVDEHLLWWVYTFLRKKNNSKELKRT